MRIGSFPLLASLALCGCAANSYCKGEFAYQKAPSVPVIKGADGLKLPESSSALKIPPAPAAAAHYGEIVKDKDGDETVVCLDAPPAMPPPASPKAAELPAPLAKTDTAAAPMAPAVGAPGATTPAPPRAAEPTAQSSASAATPSRAVAGQAAKLRHGAVIHTRPAANGPAVSGVAVDATLMLKDSTQNPEGRWWYVKSVDGATGWVLETDLDLAQGAAR